MQTDNNTMDIMSLTVVLFSHGQEPLGGFLATVFPARITPKGHAGGPSATMVQTIEAAAGIRANDFALIFFWRLRQKTVFNW